MCGRFTLRASASTIAEQFAVFDVPPFAPRFNIAPTQPVAVVRLDPQQPEPSRQLVWLRWGLIPSWAKDPAIGNRMINARAETAAQRPAFRQALQRRRCLVVADGFYEWQRSGGKKQPYFVRLRDDRPFAFAGLWESWQAPEQAAVESCALLTTEPNDLIRPIHNRMPAILYPQHYAAWLDPKVQTSGAVASMLGPFPSSHMMAYPVGTLVNNPRNDDPRCIEPAPGVEN